MSQMRLMPETPKMLSALLFPLGGLLLLGSSLAVRTGTAAPPSMMDMGTTQMAPASVNKVRLTILRRQYRFYRICQREQRGHTPHPGRGRCFVKQAAALYNQVAAETDPSAFDNTNLPRHL